MMVKILAFPGMRGSKRAPQSHDASQPLPDIASTMDGTLVISGAVAEAPTRVPSGDWTNQELADLYRVESLLIQANIRISTERGLTDENDPWFVFCREDGDVFVHLARFDGEYLLDSPGVGEVLRGHAFADLIERFMQLAAERAAPKGNVVTLRPKMLHDQTIRLHPAVMLAALVWSLYLASDDFVGVAHSAEDLAARDVNFDHHDAATHLDGATAALRADLALAHLNERAGAPTETLATPATERTGTVSGETGKQMAAEARHAGNAATAAPVVATAQGIAASLAVIAVSYGLYSVPQPPEEQDHHEAADVGPELPAPAIHGEIAPSHDDKFSTDVGSFTAAHETAPKAAPVHDIKLPDLQISLPVLKSEITEEIKHIAAGSAASGDALVSNAPKVALAETLSSREDGQAAAASETAKTSGSGSVDSTHSSETSTAIDVASTQSLLSLVSLYLGQVSAYQVGDLSVSATLDLTSLDTVLAHLNGAKAESTETADAGATVEADSDGDKATDTAASDTAGPAGTPAPAPPSIVAPPPPGHYDLKAQTFVAHLIQEGGPIEMVMFGSEILLVDMSALDEKTDQAMTRSWVTDDGHVISTIGHAHDFLLNGLA